MKKRYDVKAIMNKAHELRRNDGLTMKEALRAAWAEADVEPGRNPRLYPSGMEKLTDLLKLSEAGQKTVISHSLYRPVFYVNLR